MTNSDQQTLENNVAILMNKKYQFKKLYRIFLLDYDETEEARLNPGTSYKINYANISLGGVMDPFPAIPTLDEQIKIAKFNVYKIIDVMEINNHYLIRNGQIISAILHKKEDVSEKAYQIALKEAVKCLYDISNQTQRLHSLIDATLKGDRKKAEENSKIFWYE